jgi:hypothetical protein
MAPESVIASEAKQSPPAICGDRFVAGASRHDRRRFPWLTREFRHWNYGAIARILVVLPLDKSEKLLYNANNLALQSN